MPVLEDPGPSRWSYEQVLHFADARPPSSSWSSWYHPENLRVNAGLVGKAWLAALKLLFVLLRCNWFHVLNLHPLSTASWHMQHLQSHAIVQFRKLISFHLYFKIHFDSITCKACSISIYYFNLSSRLWYVDLSLSLPLEFNPFLILWVKSSSLCTFTFDGIFPKILLPVSESSSRPIYIYRFLSSIFKVPEVETCVCLHDPVFPFLFSYVLWRRLFVCFCTVSAFYFKSTSCGILHLFTWSSLSLSLFLCAMKTFVCMFLHR